MYNCVYILTVPSGHFYIGSTWNFTLRLRRHLQQLKRNKHHSKLLQQHFKDESDITSKLIPCDSRMEAYALEEKMIAESWDNPLFCNTQRPEDRGANLRGIKRPDAVGKKISAAKTGVLRGPMSKENKKKISEALRNNPANAAHRERLRAAALGKSLSDEHRAKIAAGKKGYRHPQEVIDRIAAAVGVSVEVDGIVYRSQAQAGEAHGVSTPTVRKRCKSDLPEFRNWKFI